jgi:hypothetical protein
MKAVDYVDADRIQTAKKKEAFMRFSDLLRIQK